MCISNLWKGSSWTDFPYKPIIEALGREHSVYIVIGNRGNASMPEGIQALGKSNSHCAER
ncbi:hypothetical protein Back11_50950 [Paenibacillus baekrokdamisoli]|uniref:Uncharacterized protein n=1 Tax=Paenibacillus baekrokdamisoli TaxID=1712516 RepID=A0A3G9IXZ9_9BACL|nr:hypothetical protein [Paenibacillus baekrokdamisoli]MBB3068928.1 hypothetical protein [Paenibacillus baekrokdamisoli]BBH23750.1 hypothetical protein Back11_50950 [Paenibacillus baekrokdamisoli]